MLDDEDKAEAGRFVSLKPTVRRLLSDEVYGQILDIIICGDFDEGDKLPAEKDMAQGFGVSRPILRKALLQLKCDGLIDIRHGIGSFITRKPASRTRDYANSADIAQFLRFLEVRMPVEATMASFAAQRRSEAQFNKILDCHVEFVRQLRSENNGINEDIAFHDSIAAATGNDIYRILLESLNELSNNFMSVTSNLTRSSLGVRGPQVIHEHESIVEAIRTQEPEAASIAMKYHLTQARNRLLNRNVDGQKVSS